MRIGIAIAIMLGLAVVTGAGIGHSYAVQESDSDIVLSNVPLTSAVQNAELEGEHQANDMGTVIILIVESCSGTPI